MKTILYNDMIDLLISASSYVQDWKSCDESAEPGNCEDQRNIWEDIFDRELTLFVRQDAKLFFKNTAFVFFLVRIAAREADIVTFLRTIDYPIMIEEINQQFGSALIDVSTSADDIRTLLREALNERNVDDVEDTLQIFMEILRSPGEIMMRIANTLELLHPLFKSHFFGENALAEIEAELAICNQHLLETPELFVRQVTFVNYSDQTKVLPDFKYFILYAAKEEVIFMHSQHILLFGIAVRRHIEKEARRVDLQAFIKLVSDPTRYDILKLLNKQKWYGNELAKHFNLTPATISHHLNKFITLRLIRAESGPQNKIFFELDRDELKRILKDIEKDLLS